MLVFKARRTLHCFIKVFLLIKCFNDDALPEVVNHYENRTLYLVLRITPKSRARVCVQWRISSGPLSGSVLLTILRQ